jgi:Ca2+/Na+ antiporter
MALIMAMLFLDAWFDSYKIKKQKTIHHTGEVITLSLIALMAFIWNLNLSIWLYGAWLFHFACMRVLLFNKILNGLMGWDEDYLWTTSDQDNLFRKLKRWGFDRILRVAAVMLSSFLVVGELSSTYLNEQQENLFAWFVFGSIAMAGCFFVYWHLKDEAWQQNKDYDI